jgi:hypothetical protein
MKMEKKRELFQELYSTIRWQLNNNNNANERTLKWERDINKYNNGLFKHGDMGDKLENDSNYYSNMYGIVSN